MRFLRNNYDNIGLRAIYYSTPDGMQMLRKRDLIDGDGFTTSSGYSYLRTPRVK
jgi:hypothetical protein